MIREVFWGLFVVASSLSPAMANEDVAMTFVEFVHDFHGKCVMRHGKMLQVRNLHPNRAIRIYVFRYYAEKRQPGRAVHTLMPEAEPLSLGCTMVQGRPQTWKIVRAQFLD